MGSRVRQLAGGEQTNSVAMVDEVAIAAGADHYDRDDDSDEDDSKQQQRSSKRRRITEDDAADGEQRVTERQRPPSSAEQSASSASSSSPAPVEVEEPTAARKALPRPTAGSRSAAERDKRKALHADDARNTPSITAFFSAANGQRGSKKPTTTAAAGSIESFFGKQGQKKAGRPATDDVELKAGESENAEQQRAVPESEQQSSPPAHSPPVAAEEDSKAAAASTSEAKADEATASPQVSKPTTGEATRPSAETKTVKAAALPVRAAAKDKKDARKRGGPLSKMKRKKMEAEGRGREQGEEEGAEDDRAAGLQEVADKEEAAIEEEDAAAASSSSDEDDEAELARDLMDSSKAATEEKIEQEEGETDAGGAASAAKIASLLGTDRYHPVRHASWTAGQPVPYSALCAMFAAVEAESSRLRIIAILSDFLRSIIALTPSDLLPAMYLCINAIAPAYEGKETGVGDFILKKVIAATTGLSLSRLRETAKDVTDLGVLALSQRKKQVVLFSSAPLSVRGVFAAMKELAAMSGKQAATRKEGVITKLMVACKGDEPKFLIRSLQGSLRIGLQSKSVIAALARALVITPPALQSAVSSSASSNAVKSVLDTRRTLSEKKLQEALEQGLAVLKQAYIECPNLQLIVSAVLQHGLQALPSHCSLHAGVPVEVMLGRPASSITAIIERFSGRLFTLEYKYDGERAQVHRCKDGSVHVYSRNSEDNSSKYPDIAARMRRYEAKGLEEYILDTECVAWDTAQRRILPFQTLTTRKRKDVREEDITVQVMLFAFDLLLLNGQSLLQHTLRQRRELLQQSFLPVEGELAFACHKDTADVEEIQSFLSQAVTDSCEGLMVKALDDDSQYTPGKRSWLKCKKDYLDGVGDTLDLVPVAAFYGKGKRTGAYGAYVLACYDEDSESFQSVTKIGTGFSEEQIAALAAFYNAQTEEERLLPACPRYVSMGDALHPDVYLKPVQVWEIKCADISISPVHQAAVGRVDAAKGLALRFPRFVRVRDDKRPEEATSSEQIVDLYHAQSVRAGHKGKSGPADDDD